MLGLAWTSMGGSTLFVESVRTRENEESASGRIKVTGQLGEVMQESISIAHSYARRYLAGMAFSLFSLS